MELQALENLKSYLGFDMSPTNHWTINEYDKSIDELSPYSISDSISSLLILNGLLIANLWENKSGTSQVVSVNRERAMELLYRPNFIHINGRPLSLDAFKKHTSLTHKTKNGFIETTTALSHLHEGVLNLLHVPPDKLSVDNAFLARTSESLEEELNTRQLGGATIRTREEFRKHPQGIELLKSPPFIVESLNSRDPLPFKSSSRPLSDIKVLDMSHILAGPVISNLLAEQGANVLHIANPGGERVASNWLDTGHGKRCANLDFNDSDDIHQLHTLIAESDIFVNGYSAGRLQEKFGLTDEFLLSINPDLIIVSSSAFGETGEWSRRAGWENIAQAAIGSMDDHGSPERPLHCPYGFLNDYATGLMGSIGALSALHKRASEGGAQRVKVSLARTGLWIQDQGIGEKAAVSDVLEKFLSVVQGGNKSQYAMMTKTSFGDLTHLAPVIQYSETKAYWDLPVEVIGSSYPVWQV